ncbi:DUF3592 domain-containing protein [Streptomyces sp. NPDC057900]|uniref:DUF3592 domain-containing protein n=1 Tax=Streptomyces sp. NPDC057900 TaxID=3346274 RepID=UPI0036EC05EC
MVWIWVVAGVIVLCCGVHEAYVQHGLRRDGMRVRGLVVSHNVSSGPNGGGTFPVVEFVDAQGRRHTFQSRSSGIRRLPVGGEVPVRYSPADPNVARIDLVGRRIFDVGILLLVGALFLTLGILMVLGVLTGSGDTPHGL